MILLCLIIQLNNSNLKIRVILLFVYFLLIFQYQFHHQKKDDLIELIHIILYELTQLSHPFFDDEIDIEKSKENIQKGELLEFLNLNYSARLLNIIKSLFIVEPNKRPDINKLLIEAYTILIKKDSHSKRK